MIKNMKNIIIINKSNAIHVLILSVLFYTGCGTTQVQNEKSSSRPSIPEEAVRLYDEGVKLNFEKRYTDAIYCFTEAIRIAPSFQRAYVIRGAAFYVLEMYFDAILDFDSAISLGRQDITELTLAYYMKGMSYSALGDYETAIENYNKVLSINKRAPDAYHERGIAYYHLGKMGEALSDVTIAIYIDRANYKYFDTRGTIFFKLGHYNNALADLAESLRLNPDGSSAYFGRGTVYMALERYDEALRDFNKSLELNPGNKDAYNNRSVLYTKLAELSDDTDKKNEYLIKARADNERGR